MNNNPTCEDAPACGCCGQTPGETWREDDADFEARQERAEMEYEARERKRLDALEVWAERNYETEGREDDFADFNDREAEDYRDE